MNRRWQSRVLLVFLGFAGATALSTRAAVAQSGPSPDLLNETQKLVQDAGKLTMVWWLPEELWSASSGPSGAFSAEQHEAFLRAVTPYLIIAAADGKLGPLGGAEFVDKESVRASIKVIDKAGKSYAPLPEDQLTGDVKVLSAVIGSLFGNMLGAMGQGLHLFFFPATSADGLRIASAAKEGTFSVALGDQSFTWRLPLGSVLAPKTCPVDGEMMTGAWKYCPWHGKPLEDAKSKKGEPKP